MELQVATHVTYLLGSLSTDFLNRHCVSLQLHLAGVSIVTLASLS